MPGHRGGVPALHSAGNLYGSGTSGGTGGWGVAFKLTPSDGTWDFTSLHGFSGGNDGAEPGGNVVLDSQGNLYGCAESGGLYSEGIVWQITP